MSEFWSCTYLRIKKVQRHYSQCFHFSRNSRNFGFVQEIFGKLEIQTYGNQIDTIIFNLTFWFENAKYSQFAFFCCSHIQAISILVCRKPSPKLWIILLKRAKSALSRASHQHNASHSWNVRNCEYIWGNSFFELWKISLFLTSDQGHDTTAAAVSWALFQIGLNQNIQARLHKEMDSIFGMFLHPSENNNNKTDVL